MRTLKKGMRGADVAQLKSRLVELGYLHQSTHDSFGNDTDAAVRAFQRDNGLTVDGIVGKHTWAALGVTDMNHTEKIKAMEDLLKLIVGDYYIIGGQGHELTKPYLNSRRATFPSYFTDGRYEWLCEQIELANKLNRKLYCADCSDLFWWVNDTVQIIPGVKDSTADTLWRKYCEPITKEEVRPGDILFREGSSKMVHMALVGYEGTYEAAGTAYGVVHHAEIFDRVTLDRMENRWYTLQPWTHYGRLKTLM